MHLFRSLRLRKYLLDNSLATEAEIKAIDKRVEDEVRGAYIYEGEGSFVKKFGLHKLEQDQANQLCRGQTS
jgi:TPP-dependent pyruvate/acetoin dehydrogenase alpha subunit